jgi:uncharacterized SAM-binding protein YcdF (DUF218 family)
MHIIIFGAAVKPSGAPSATLRRRVEAAFSFGGPTAQYIPTGGPSRAGPSEASVMRDLLVEQGVPREQVICEETGADTFSSALACARLLKGRADVFAASSTYHLPRCVLLLRMAGLRARACWPLPADFSAYWSLRESVALPYDAFLMWHHQRRLLRGYYN